MESKKKPTLNAFARYSGIAFQMGITIYLGNLLGVWLDEKYDNKEELYTKVVTLIAVFLSMYLVIKQVVRDSKNM